MKILLVDDHVLFRAGLRMLLSALDGQLVIVECDTCEGAANLARENRDIRLCLLDLHLRDENGLGAIPAIKEAIPGVAVVVLSADEDPKTIHAALEEGAMGYIPKSSSPEIMTRALELVLAGGIYLPVSVLGTHPAAPRSLPAPCSGSWEQLGLTQRQYEVLQCLLRGLPNKLICRELCMAEGTVKTHLSAIYRALAVGTRSQAVVAAGRLGLTTDLRSGASPGR